MRKIVFERSDGLSSFGCVNPAGCCYEWIWRMVSLLTSRQNHSYQQEASSLSHPKEVFSVFVNSPPSSIPYLNNRTPNDVRNDAMLIHSPTDFTLFSFIVDCPARTVFGCT